jgi:predicted TIM-barrel fold metal-dependent hydrolase
MTETPLDAFLQHDAATKKPQTRAPSFSCDAHFHVFGDPQTYRSTSAATYATPAAYENHQRAMHGVLGIERGVFCQPTIYGADHSFMIDFLSRTKGYRGVAIIDETVTASELERLDAAGVRAARFNFAKFLGMAPSKETVRSTLARIAPLGWHVKIHGSLDEIEEHLPALLDSGVAVVVDHFARIDFGAASRAERDRVIKLLEVENWWILISNGQRLSKAGYPWSDTVSFARECFAAAPSRTLWATDWPHVRHASHMPNDGDLLDLLGRYLPDPADREQVLVRNPEALYGFAPGERFA